MGKFVTKLEISFLEPKEIAKRGLSTEETYGFLDADLIYVTNNGLTIVIPKGFITDFASIPRAFWSILPPISPFYVKAAVIHDFIYTSQGKLPNIKRVYTRKDADLLFLEIMILENAPTWKRNIMYAAVRAFGYFAWKSKERREETYY